MKTAFVQLRINGKLYEAIFHVTKSFYGEIAYYRIFSLKRMFPVIGFFERDKIFQDWLKEDWFKNAVPDFELIRNS